MARLHIILCHAYSEYIIHYYKKKKKKIIILLIRLNFKNFIS